MVRIPGFHPGDPGSIPGRGILYGSYGAIGSASDSRPEGWGFDSL